MEIGQVPGGPVPSLLEQQPFDVLARDQNHRVVEDSHYRTTLGEREEPIHHRADFAPNEREWVLYGSHLVRQARAGPIHFLDEGCP